MLTLQTIGHGTYDAHSVGKEWKANPSPAVPSLTSSPGARWDFGVTNHQGPRETPGLQSTCTEGDYGNYFGEMIIIWMFIPGKSMDMYVKYNLNQELSLYSAVRIFWRRYPLVHPSE